MSKIIVTFPDKTRKEYHNKVNLLKLSSDFPSVIVAKVNGKLVDLSTNIEEDSEVEFLNISSPEGLEIYRHSTSHLMAHAVKELFPEAKVAIGPAIEDGFYYDFDISKPFEPEDLQKIEMKMKEIAEKNLSIDRIEVSKEKATEIFKEIDETYKVELLSEIEEKTVSLYKQDNFVDLCRGPHVPSTGRLKAFKLLSSAGAYWRGNERNKMLQRIYGTCYENQEELESHLRRLEEIAKRDHRRLGKDLGIFSIHEEVGGGLIHWHPKGAIIRNVIEDYWKKEHLKEGYQLVCTPHIASEEIYDVSGHLENYLDLMYSPMDIEGRPFRLKPMNCPGHILIYKTHLHSYREMPIKLAEMGTVYRFERSGVLHGLLRVRGFTIDDAHIFCRPDQVESSVIEVINFSLRILRSFGFNKFNIYLATKPEKSVGSEENWAEATSALQSSLDKVSLDYSLDKGGGAFYGPKIDIKIQDALGREWQCSTIQFDFNLPERFNIVFIAEDGKAHRPFMIHRAVLGSLERFVGILIENYAGSFPLWISPIQIVVLSITESQISYAKNIVKILEGENLRVIEDFRNEKIGAKIRDAEIQKIPYMVIVGKSEEIEKNISVRKRHKGDFGKFLLEDFLRYIKKEIDNKQIE